MLIRMANIARDLPDALGLSKTSLNAALVVAQHMAYHHWGVLADRELNTSRTEYKRGIKLGEFAHGKSVSVLLEGEFPNMIEHGRDAWNLRETILKPGTKNLHQSKDGHYYVHVPFRHYVKNIGKPYAELGFSDALVKRIQRGVNATRKELLGSRGAPGRGTKWGDRLPSGLAPLLRRRHVTDIYAGMVRQQKKYAVADQSYYMTFRTISNNPDTIREDNWTHPGIKARNLVDRVMDYAVDAFMREIGKETTGGDA